MPRLSFCLVVEVGLHLGELLSSGVVLLEARCACGCGAPFARTPPVLRLSHRLSVRRACCHSSTHFQPSSNRHVVSYLSQRPQLSQKARTQPFVLRLRGTSAIRRVQFVHVSSTVGNPTHTQLIQNRPPTIPQPRNSHSPTAATFARLHGASAALVWTQLPWTTRFAHGYLRARAKVHSPRVVEARRARQRALATPTDGLRPHFATSTLFQPLYIRFPIPHKPSETSTHPQPSFIRHLNHSPTTFQPPLVRFSPVVRPTFCRTHSPTSHPHFTYSAHTTPSSIRRADLRQLSVNHHTTTPQPSSNHHPHAPRPRLLQSAATRTVILIPLTPLQDALQPCPNTEKAGRPKPARPGARETRAAAAYSTTSLIGTLSVSESTSGSMFVRLKLSSAAYSPGSSGACSSVTFATPPASSPNVAG